MTRPQRAALCALAGWLLLSGLVWSADAPRLQIEPNDGGQGITLRGQDARQQLIITRIAALGELRDSTHQVQYRSDPAGIVAIDAQGRLAPTADGETVVTATDSAGLTASVPVVVRGMAEVTPIDFAEQITPIFTKHSCNSGGCHGKSGGQNGFALSLLGFVPEDDYSALVNEARGRRIFPAAPAGSLLLRKAIGESPHGGGKRLDAESDEYRLILRWIAQGAPAASANPRQVTRIECLPSARMLARGQQQQLAVLAYYSDGSREDVTRSALYEANNTEMAEVSATGLVATREMTGEVAIMARYQGQVATFRATIPLGQPVEQLPPVVNFVDEAVFNKLKLLGLPPSPIAEDAAFLRRVTIDIAGRLPTEAEVQAFLSDAAPSAKKRDQLIDRLLASSDYADYFANKWNAILRNRTGQSITGERVDGDLPGTLAFYQWIWRSIYENKPYDQFARELLTAAGEKSFMPPVVWYREVNSVEKQVEDTAQLFLGVRIQCARCHHHPFEKWSQEDYHRLAAFFSRLGQKNLAGVSEQKKQLNRDNQSRDLRIYHNPGPAFALHPRSQAKLTPAGLGQTPSKSADPNLDPRQQLVDWLSQPDNPFFARALVNRYWKHFFGRGIVEPEDDMRATNPPTNPELLDGLAQSFIASGFDTKELIRTICRSSSYQLSSQPNAYNASDKQNFSRFAPRRLQAEVLYDGFHQATGVSERFAGLPAGSRAMQLPDASAGPYFLKVFGKPAGDSVCECERIGDATLAQSLHFVNSQEVQSKLADKAGRAALLAADRERPLEPRVAELYRSVFARNPTADELRIAVAHLSANAADAQVAWEDLIWALVTSNEFLFNH